MSGKILKAPDLGAAAPNVDPNVASVAAGGRRNRPKVVDRRLILAHDEARRVLEAAEARAREIAAAAEESARQALGQAREEGFAEGLARLEDGLVKLAEERASLLQAARPQAVGLAVKIAEKILRRRLDDTPAALVPVVEEALRALQGQGAVQVRVHPSRAAALSDHRRRLLDREPRWSRLDVVADESLAADGCLVESELGRLDAGVAQQLTALERLLRRAAS